MTAWLLGVAMVAMSQDAPVAYDCDQILDAGYDAFYDEFMEDRFESTADMVEVSTIFAGCLAEQNDEAAEEFGLEIEDVRGGLTNVLQSQNRMNWAMSGGGTIYAIFGSYRQITAEEILAEAIEGKGYEIEPDQFAPVDRRMIALLNIFEGDVEDMPEDDESDWRSDATEAFRSIERGLDEIEDAFEDADWSLDRRYSLWTLLTSELADGVFEFFD